MKLEYSVRAGLFILAAVLLAGPARATNYQTFNFTGTGTNGVTAYGSMTIDLPSEGYFAIGSIFTQGISVTVENIPGPGPSSVTFSYTNPLSNTIQNSWLNVVGGSIYVGPQGEYDYVSADRYWFPSSPTQPTFSYYETAFNFNLTPISTITWSAATLAVPEPSAYAALAGVAALGFVAIRRRRAV